MVASDEAIDWAVSFIERLEEPSAPFGVPHLGSAFPYYELSADAKEFVGGLYDRGLVATFDWPAWQEVAETYVSDPELLAEAPMDDCLRLLTTHVRADRFCEGHLVAMLESGHVAAVLRRMREIRGRRSVDR